MINVPFEVGGAVLNDEPWTADDTAITITEVIADHSKSQAFSDVESCRRLRGERRRK